jgi:hypothetical protein
MLGSNDILNSASDKKATIEPCRPIFSFRAQIETGSELDIAQGVIRAVLDIAE